jgi:hypothetical protein
MVRYLLPTGEEAEAEAYSAGVAVVEPVEVEVKVSFVTWRLPCSFPIFLRWIKYVASWRAKRDTTSLYDSHVHVIPLALFFFFL